MANVLTRLWRRTAKLNKTPTLLQLIATGTLFRANSVVNSTALSNIRTQIKTMRALANDSQIGVALSYYSTDATTPNSDGQIIWATPKDPQKTEAAEIANTKFAQWNINTYARDHILELATIGNFYLPTTDFYKASGTKRRERIALDNNTIRDDSWDIVPSTIIDAEDVIHLWYQGKPCGFAYQVEEDNTVISYSEGSIIHFSLGGLIGRYNIDGKDENGDPITYDVQFGSPLFEKAVQPTQTLSLLEDASILASLSRMVKFINVECGDAEETEIQAALQQIKDMVEQQISINTDDGDMQSFVNPQSPNNLIYLPKINGTDAISITDMNMAEFTDAENKLLEYYQNKKLSVLGVPKEAMNYSSAEGLGGAGSVMSQRSNLYANSLLRLETAYKEGWRKALNTYFINHGLSSLVDEFELHMNPILTQLSTISFERRDSSLSQASAVVELLRSLGVSDADAFKKTISEILEESLPTASSEVNSWEIKVKEDSDNAL